jgi:hypothetical protein
MDAIPDAVPCEACGAPARRRIGYAVHSSEDRYRFFRNPIDGSKFSYAFGQEHPDNRQAYNATCERLGCEPVTRKTMPEAWKDDQAYAEHVTHGGAPEPYDGRPPTAGKLTVLDQLKKSNVRDL